jgi:protoporphyrinogen oxidase
MPLTHLLESSFPGEKVLLQQTREKLRFRNTILTYICAAGQSSFQDQWIYINEVGVKIGRVTNFNNWHKTTSENTILCLEMWCDSSDLLWNMADSEISALATKELLGLSFFKNLTVTDSSVVRLPNSYPVYMRDYLSVFKSVAGFLSGFENLFCIGRAGGFRYNNQDHSILMGLLAFENIALGKKHDIWNVNLDCDYQETGTWPKQSLK